MRLAARLRARIPVLSRNRVRLPAEEAHSYHRRFPPFRFTGHWPLATLLSSVATRYRPLSLLLPRALSLPSRAGAIGSNGSLPASWGTAPPAADRLRYQPSGSGADDLTVSDKELCVDFSLALLGAFCGTRHSSCAGSLRWRSPSHSHPTSPRFCHPPSGICHPPSAICHPPSLLSHSPFRIPQLFERSFGQAPSPELNREPGVRKCPCQ